MSSHPWRRCNPCEGAQPSLRLAPCPERESITFILFRYLRVAVLASGNQARPLVALGVYDHQHPAQGIDAQNDKPLLALRIGVFDSAGHRIKKHLLGMSKADPVLAKVRPCFDRIEFDALASLCIFYAYVQPAGLRLLQAEFGEINWNLTPIPVADLR